MENQNENLTNSPEEDSSSRKKWALRYAAVLIAGLLLIALSFGLTAHFSNKTKEQQEENASRTAESAKNAQQSEEAGKTGAQDAETTKDRTATEASLAIDVPVDSYYQYVNDYDWEDLYSLMINICLSGVGLSEGSTGKDPSFALFSFDAALDPMIFVGFTDPATGKSTTTLYITDHSYVYELLKVDDEKIYVDWENGRIMTGSGQAYYRYTPHVLLKSETGSGTIPPEFEELPMTDARGQVVTSENIGMFLSVFEEGGQK